MNNVDLVYKLATNKDREKIDTFLQGIADEINDIDTFVYDGSSYWDMIYPDNGFYIKALNSSNEIVAVFVVRYAEPDDQNLGKDISLPEEELPFVAHTETIAVRKDYRGLGIHSAMLKFAEDLIPAHYRHYCTTVAPHNFKSKNNFIKAGYKVILTTEKYNSIRDILYKSAKK